MKFYKVIEYFDKNLSTREITFLLGFYVSNSRLINNDNENNKIIIIMIIMIIIIMMIIIVIMIIR